MNGLIGFVDTRFYFLFADVFRNCVARVETICISLNSNTIFMYYGSDVATELPKPHQLLKYRYFTATDESATL